MTDYHALAGLPADVLLDVAKARCRIFRDSVPPEVLEKLDTEALIAGDPITVHRAQLKLGAAAVQRLRKLLRGDLSDGDRDTALSLLLDFLILLRGTDAMAADPPELAGLEGLL